MATQGIALNQSSGVFCPLCDRQGIVNSEMVKKSNGPLVCTVQGHKIEYMALMAMKPRMRQLQITEKQPQGTVSQAIWFYPEVIEALRRRYPQNLMTTLCSTMTALADEDTLLITGEEARALRELGCKRGRDIIGLAEANKTLNEDLKRVQVERATYAPLLKLLQLLGGAGGNSQLSSLLGEMTHGQALNAEAPPPHSHQVDTMQPDWEPSAEEIAQGIQLSEEAAAAGRRTAMARSSGVMAGAGSVTPFKPTPSDR